MGRPENVALRGSTALAGSRAHHHFARHARKDLLTLTSRP